MFSEIGSSNDIGIGERSPGENETETVVKRLANSPRPAHLRLTELLKLLRIQASIFKVYRKVQMKLSSFM